MLIAGDDQHFAAIAESLAQSIADLSDRLDGERRAPGGIGQEAMDRDLEIHRLTARLRSPSSRSDRSAIDCARLSAMAAKCCSSPAISIGSDLRARWSGRSNALVVRGFTFISSDPKFVSLDPNFGAHERGRTLL